MAGSKGLIEPSPGDKEAANNSQQLTLESVAKARAEANRKRAKAGNQLKKRSITSGALVYAPVLFTYVNGTKTWIRVQKSTIQKCGIKKPPEGTLSAEGSGISFKKTKSARVSYGYKIQDRAKKLNKGSKGLNRGGDSTKKQVRAWLTISVPADANFLDVVYFVKQFSKPAGLVQVGQQQFLINYNRAMGGAGAAK